MLSRRFRDGGKILCSAVCPKKWSRKKPADRTRVHCAELRFHRVMECYQFSAAAGVTEQIEAMLAGGQITEEMKRLVKPAPHRDVSHIGGGRADEACGDCRNAVPGETVCDGIYGRGTRGIPDSETERNVRMTKS